MLGANRDGDSPRSGSLAVLSAAAGGVRRQFLFGNGDEPIPDFGQFVANVPETLRLLVQTTGVIVADEDDMVARPTTDESLGIGLERGFVEITTTALIALAKQQSEYGSLAIGRPFPEFGTSAEAPRTDMTSSILCRYEKTS